jgi:hypothetical protein
MSVSVHAGLGAFPAPQDRFVLLIVKPDGAIEVRARPVAGPSFDPRQLAHLMRDLADRIEAESLGVHFLQPGGA